MIFPKNMSFMNEFSENMIMKTLTISKFLEGILPKEFDNVQDLVKKTKAVENYQLSSSVKTLFAASDSNQSQ